MLWTLLGLAQGSLQAQQTPPRIELSVYCFGYADGLETIQLRTARDVFTPLHLSTVNIIGPHTVPVIDEFITLHTDAKDAAGNPIRPVVAAARIPPGLGRALVVLIPARANAPRPYTSLLIPHTDGEFPFGSYKLINLSPHPIRGAIGPARVSLRSGAVEHLNPGATPGEIMLVRFDYLKQDLWHPFTETRWAKTDDRRSIICIYHDPQRDRVMLRSIPDRTHLKISSPATADAVADESSSPVED